MTERWYGEGGRYVKENNPNWWLFLNIWCLFDVVLFPFSFFLACAINNVNFNLFIYPERYYTLVYVSSRKYNHKS